jgi:hypothetical protein
MLGPNAGEARNSDLMRKPESAASERQRQCNPLTRGAVFTIEQYGFVFFVILGR